MDLSSVNSKNVPKLATSELTVKDNYYVVKTGQLYNYYPIKVKTFTETDSIIRFEKSPPVLMEGIAIVGKKPYRVTPQDLLRQIIRKSREVAVPKRDKVNGKSGNVGTVEPASIKAIQHSNQSGVSAKTEVEEHAVADAAWDDQIGALFDFIAAKEGEFEITDSSQS
jgi:hypothetical protein